MSANVLLNNYFWPTKPYCIFSLFKINPVLFLLSEVKKNDNTAYINSLMYNFLKNSVNMYNIGRASMNMDLKNTKNYFVG